MGKRGKIFTVLLLAAAIIWGFVTFIKEDPPVSEESFFVNNETTTGNTITSVINKRAANKNHENPVNFTYDFDQNPVYYAIDRPFNGVDCGLISYNVSQMADELYIEEKMEGKCSKGALFYITTVLTEDADINKIRLVQILNDKKIEEYIFDIPESDKPTE